MELPHLPQEILTMIFMKLPTKSLAKCRCLSKTWLSILSTPRFNKSRLGQRPREENLLLITPSNAVHTTTSIADDAVSTKLELAASASWAVVSGSCDGLVLLTNDDGAIFLVNPTTMELVEVASSPVALEKDESFTMYGFGYDGSRDDDYKIVALSFYDTDNEHHPDVIDTFVDVYSLKSGTWKRVDSSPYDHAVPELAPGAYVGGSINWLASSRERGYRSVIAAFDLAREVFDEIPAPSAVDQNMFVFNRLVNLGGYLCMADARGSSLMEVWIMREYGDRESWTKFSVEVDYEWDLMKPLCYIGEEGDDDAEVVFVTEGESLVVYDRMGKTLRDMTVDGVQAAFVDGCVYVESLLSPRLGRALNE